MQHGPRSTRQHKHHPSVAAGSATLITVDRPHAMADDERPRHVIVDGITVYQPVLRISFFEPGRGRRVRHFTREPWIHDQRVGWSPWAQEICVLVGWERPHWPDSNPDDVVLLWRDPRHYDHHWYIGEVPSRTPLPRIHSDLLLIHDLTADLRLTCTSDNPLRDGFHNWMPQNGLNWNPAGMVSAWSEWTTTRDAH